eukprot:11855623-Prorocentrum_lima.AAC.1
MVQYQICNSAELLQRYIEVQLREDTSEMDVDGGGASAADQSMDDVGGGASAADDIPKAEPTSTADPAAPGEDA